MPPIVNAQSVGKRFGAVPLFEDVSFAVHDGNRIGLIGPNGAGKSTLLAVLAGEVEPDTGELSLRKRARVGYIHQISEFATGLTVRQVVAAALERAGVEPDMREQRLRETLGRTGFVDVGDVSAGGPRHGCRGGQPERRLAQAPGDRRSCCQRAGRSAAG